MHETALKFLFREDFLGQLYDVRECPPKVVPLGQGLSVAVAQRMKTLNGAIKLDLLVHCYLEDELVDHVISGIKSKKDYYIAIASEVTRAVVAGRALQAKEMTRVERMRPSFKNLSFNGVPFITDIMDAIRFREMGGGFVSNILSTKKPVRIGTLTGRCLPEDGIVYLEISEEKQKWTLCLDKYECRVTSSILGRIIGQCEFPGM